MSALGLLNFLVLQCFGVRLARVRFVVEGKRVWDVIPGNIGKLVELESLVGTGRGEVRNIRVMADAEVPSLRRWKIMRWVWPLTGWWSDYRWIARRR